MSTDGEAVRCEGIERVYRTPTGEVHALHDVTVPVPSRCRDGDRGSVRKREVVAAALDRRHGPAELGFARRGRARRRSRIGEARRRLRRDLVGYIYQRPSDNFLAHLTVGEHLRLAGRGRDPAAASIRSGCSTSWSIGDRMDHLPSELVRRRAATRRVRPGDHAPAPASSSRTSPPRSSMTRRAKGCWTGCGRSPLKE